MSEACPSRIRENYPESFRQRQRYGPDSVTLWPMAGILKGW